MSNNGIGYSSKVGETVRASKVSSASRAQRVQDKPNAKNSLKPQLIISTPRWCRNDVVVRSEIKTARSLIAGTVESDAQG